MKAAQESLLARAREQAKSEKERTRTQREQKIKAAQIGRARAIEEARMTKESEI